MPALAARHYGQHRVHARVLSEGRSHGLYTAMVCLGQHSLWRNDGDVGFAQLLGLILSFVDSSGAMRKAPVGPNVMTRVAIWIAFQIILMFGLSLPKRASRLY